MDGILSYAVFSISCRYIGEIMKKTSEFTTEHCTCIATASPQPHIKKKISKTKRKLVKFRSMQLLFLQRIEELQHKNV